MSEKLRVEDLKQIDTAFNFYSDTPKGKDPDTFSPTLRMYHRILWSKPLPDGRPFEITEDPTNRCLRHKSDAGHFVFSSDALGQEFSVWVV